MTMATRTLDVAAIRKDFPIFETGIAYLDSANTSQRPKQVTGAMLDYFEKFNSNIHRAAYRIAEEATVRYEATREKVRAFINAASTKEIIYTRRTNRSTCGRSAATCTPAAATRCWDRPGPASFTGGASCSRRWTPSWRAAT